MVISVPLLHKDVLGWHVTPHLIRLGFSILKSASNMVSQLVGYFMQHTME